MFFLKKKQARRRRKILMLFVTKWEGKQCFFVLAKQKNPPPQCAFECGFCLNWLNVKQKIGYFASRIYLCVSEFSKKSRTLMSYRIFFRSIKKSIERKNTERIMRMQISWSDKYRYMTWLCMNSSDSFYLPKKAKNRK